MVAPVGFVGVGSMGGPMAARIAQAGYPLTVLDASAARTREVAQETGATAAETGAALARASDVVVTMLPTSHVVEEVLDGPDGVLADMRTGTVLIEMSSGVPTLTRILAERVRDHGGVLVDAPVSGGVPRALTGELTIMVGGDKAAIDRVEPVLSTMGERILRTGPVGSAHAMKALNNLVSAGGFLIGVEALLIGKAFGLEPDTMVDVLNASTGVNNSTQKKFKQFVLSRRFDSGFGLGLMVKDVSIALDLARETGTATPFSAHCRELWAAAASMLGPGHDHTAMAKLSEMLAGWELATDSNAGSPNATAAAAE